MNYYKVLNKQIYSHGDFSIVPIRYEDRLDIMQWRNEQIYHLRQDKPLTVKNQEDYFNNVVANIFEQERPSQVLFSFLENEICIGYGGLVHINWIDKNAEISFVMNTQLQKNSFKKYWSIYLGLIERAAFQELSLYKIYTYAFDLRPHLYEVLEINGYKKEAVLKKHCFFNREFIDVVIHTKFFTQDCSLIEKDKLFLKDADESDAQLLFNWANDKNVRMNAINEEPISWENHINWFNNKITSSNTKMFILRVENKSVGQIRIDKIDSYWQIDYSIDFEYRGQGLGKKIVDLLLRKFDSFKFKATVKNNNEASLAVFNKLGFRQLKVDDPNFLFFEY